MTRDQRKALLKLVGRGLDIESGAAQLNLPMAEVRKSGKVYAKQLKEAFSVGSALLRARVIETAVVADDTKTISAELERRELTAAAGTAITKIERVIIDGGYRCAHCGKPPGAAPKPPKKTNGKAAHD